MKWTLAPLLLVALLGFLAGCNMIPQKEYVAAEAFEFEDGTSVEAGQPVYVDSAGRATANETGADGKPNPPVMVNDVDKVKGWQKTAEGAVGALPPPFSWLGLGVLGIVGAGAVGGLALANRKKLADLGAKPKGKV